MWIELKADSGLPLNRQIYNQIKALILRGDLLSENKLPSSRALSQTLNVARNTVLEAYEQLLAEGYLEARHGSGTTVAKGISSLPPPQPPRAALVGASPAPGPQSPLINFRSGITGLESFPKKEWGKLYQRTSESLPSSAFQYGEPGGVWELRQAIAAYLFRVRGIRAEAGRIMITSGSTQALCLISRLLYQKDAFVLVEDPAHKAVPMAAARAGHTVQGVLVDEYGMDTSGLPQPDSAAGHIAFVYVTPSHQYPLGGILPIQRRQTLIRFAREAGSLIVEDDYDSEFRYEGAPVSSLYELAPEKVIYLGSFSKILAPALRLGFAIIPEPILNAWKVEKKFTDVHTDALSQHALAAFINSGGLERHTWKMKKVYKHKRAHLLRQLAQNFAGRFEVKGEAAGLHLVATFKDITFTKKILTELCGRGVKIVPLESYSLRRDGAHAHEVILGYSHLSEIEISRGLAILKEVLLPPSIYS